MKSEKIKDLNENNKWTTLRQKNSYDYSNTPATRRDIKDLERRLLRRLTYRISALIIVVLSTLIILLMLLK